MNNEKSVKGLGVTEANKLMPWNKNYKGFKIRMDHKNGCYNIYDKHGEMEDSGFKSIESCIVAINKLIEDDPDLYESPEQRKRISYRGYIIRPRKADDGELYYDIIKPKWSTTEPIWDWCDSVEEAKQWIDSDKDEPFDESKSVNESVDEFAHITALADDCGKNTFKIFNTDIQFTFADEYDKTKFANELLAQNIPYSELTYGVISIRKSDVNDDVLEESKTLKEWSDVELTEDEKDDILFTVAMGFESGHHIYKDYEDFKSEFENISHAEAGWEYYCELINLGPAGFYAEHKDDYIFDDAFIAEYGDESEEDDGPYLGKGEVSVTAWNKYGPGELPYWSGKKFDVKEWPEILKDFADTSHGSRPFEVLSVEGSEVSGWYVYNSKTGEYVFTTKYPQELLDKLKNESCYIDAINESSKPTIFNVIDTIGDSADDTREYTQADMHDFCKELIEIEEESSEPKQYANRPKLGYDLKSITAVLKHFGYEVKPITSVKEDLSGCDEDTSMLEKMTNEGYDPFDVYSTYEIKNADTDEVIRKIHTTSMDPDDSSTWFDDDDIISQYAGDGIIITRYDYDQGMLDGSEVLYPEESEEIEESVVIETKSDDTDSELDECDELRFDINENFRLRQSNGIIS